MATYNGDSNNAAVSSGTADEPVTISEPGTITTASPTITTSPQPATATVGTSIADQATVSGGDNPTGTVTFNLYNNSTATGTPLFTDTKSLSNGTATSNGYTAATTGTDYWVATYNGDSNNAAVSSGTASEPVTVKDSTTTTLMSSQSQTAPVYGQAVTFTATVAVVRPGAGTPTGTVTFNDGTTTLGTGTLSGGVATLTVPSTSPVIAALAVGTHSITAVYLGNLNDGGSTSSALTQTVNPLTAANLQTVLATTSTVNLDAATSTDAQTILTAVNGLTAPTSTVTITVNLASGSFTDLTASPPTGVTLDLTGNGTTTTIVGTSPALQVTQGAVSVAGMTLTTATNAPTILVSGGSLTLRNTTIIQESTGGTDAAVDVTDGSVDLGTTASPGGNILNVNSLDEFVDNTTANSIPATGDTFEVNGVPISAPYLSFTSLSSSSTTTVYGQAVTLTALVRANTTPGSGTPTGSVDFFDVSTNTDLGSVSLSGGSASLTTTALGAGNHLIRALYSGDSNFTLSLDALTQTVTPAPLTITANNQTKVYGAALPTLTASYTGLVNGDTSASLRRPHAPTLTTTATASSHVCGQPLHHHRQRRGGHRLHDQLRGREPHRHRRAADDHGE